MTGKPCDGDWCWKLDLFSWQSFPPVLFHPFTHPLHYCVCWSSYYPQSIYILSVEQSLVYHVVTFSRQRVSWSCAVFIACVCVLCDPKHRGKKKTYVVNSNLHYYSQGWIKNIWRSILYFCIDICGDFVRFFSSDRCVNFRIINFILWSVDGDCNSVPTHLGFL